MAVLPEGMDKLNTDDPKQALSIIENYIGYIGERLEFSFSNMTKTVNSAGVSSAELYIMLAALTNTVSALQSTVNNLNGTINGLSAQIGTINESISSLEARVTALEEAE